MKQASVFYEIDGKKFKGHLVFPEPLGKESKPLPAIIVAHAWMGQDAFAKHKAEELAKLGYIGFAADLYGEGLVVTTPDKARSLMQPLFENRTLLQKRIRAAFDMLHQRPEVNPAKIGGIGFCFGGLTIIELLRSGAEVKGVVSFHGAFSDRMGSIRAKTVPIAKSIKGSILILHGYEDPLVSPQDIANIQKELNDAQVDWQMNIYGHAVHGFTDPEAKDHAHGLAFHALTNKRAWKAMEDFFQECFGNKT
jgi:dienelactone hydrolase